MPVPSQPIFMNREEAIRKDIQDLHRLGYAQQLFREMGGFSNFAISFSIISILTGAVLLYGYGLKFGGPVINSVGWIRARAWFEAIHLRQIPSRLHPNDCGREYRRR